LKRLYSLILIFFSDSEGSFIGIRLLLHIIKVKAKHLPNKSP